MKKKICTFSALVAAAMVFSACANTASSIAGTSSAPSTPAPPSSAASEASSEPDATSVPGGDAYGEFKVILPNEETRVVVFGSDEISFQVVSSLIVRNGNALLVDTKFSKTDAQEIIRYLQDNDINLTQIFISHGDPDYYFGLEEFRAAFPDATVSTTTSVAEHVEATIATKLEVWAEALGDELPQNFVMPENLVDTSFTFEGLDIEIFGSDATRITLYIPELSMLLGGGNITSGNHLFLADMSLAEDRVRWRENLVELQGVGAAMVIPGHADLALEMFDGQAIDFSIAYLDAAEEVLPTIETGEEFVAAMEAQYPNLRSREVLVLSGSVLTGEMEWRRYVDN